MAFRTKEERASFKKKKYKTQGKTNICFDCQKACGDCSWSALDPVTLKPQFVPIPGWTATKVVLKTGHPGKPYALTETYHITKCPEFVPDKKRKSASLELTEEQFAFLLKQWKRRGEWE